MVAARSVLFHECSQSFCSSGSFLCLRKSERTPLERVTSSMGLFACSFGRASLDKNGLQRMAYFRRGFVLADDVLLQAGSLPHEGLFGKVSVAFGSCRRLRLRLLGVNSRAGRRSLGALRGKGSVRGARQLQPGSPNSLCT